MKRAALALLLCLVSFAAFGQSTVRVIGPVTPGDCVKFFSSTQISDSGAICGGGSGSPGGLNGQVQFNNAGTFGGLTNAQLTALINPATAALSGALPAWPNNTTTFFRGDGTYQTLNFAAIGGTLNFSSLGGQASLAQLPTIGANTVLGSIAGGTPIALTQTQLTALINLASSSLAGLLPAFPGTTTTYFRGDGTYQPLTFAALGSTPNTLSGYGITSPLPITQGGTASTTILGARGSGGLNIDELTTTGTSNYVMLSTDRTVAHTSLTHAVIDSLPLAASVNPGQVLRFRDIYNQITSVNTVTIQPIGADTLNGVVNVVLNSGFAGFDFVSDGVSNWNYVPVGAGGGSGTVTQVLCAKGAVCSPITTTGTVTAPAALLAASTMSGAI